MTHIDILLGLVTALAALTDARTGKIPNWLTLPAIVLSPFAHAALGGRDAALTSAVGIVLCGLPPLVVFLRGGIGGGDVKLFAAIGGLCGPVRGLEVQTLSYVLAAGAVIVLCARKGALGALLGRALCRRNRTLSPLPIDSLRLGVPIALSAAGLLVLDMPWS